MTEVCKVRCMDATASIVLAALTRCIFSGYFIFVTEESMLVREARLVFAFEARQAYPDRTERFSGSSRMKQTGRRKRREEDAGDERGHYKA